MYMVLLNSAIGTGYSSPMAEDAVVMIDLELGQDICTIVLQGHPGLLPVGDVKGLQLLEGLPLEV